MKPMTKVSEVKKWCRLYILLIVINTSCPRRGKPRYTRPRWINHDWWRKVKGTFQCHLSDIAFDIFLENIIHSWISSCRGSHWDCRQQKNQDGSNLRLKASLFSILIGSENLLCRSKKIKGGPRNSTERRERQLLGGGKLGRIWSKMA